jgi:hypothetical protein
MFGFVKELILVGKLAVVFSNLVKQECGDDYFRRLSNGTKNNMMDKALKAVAGFHGTKIAEVMDKHLEDCIVVSYLLLAIEISSTDMIGNLAVTGGMTLFIQNNKAKISITALDLAMQYVKEQGIS